MKKRLVALASLFRRMLPVISLLACHAAQAQAQDPTAVSATPLNLTLPVESPGQRSALADSVVVARDDGRPWHDSGYRWKEPPSAAPDWRGLKRDTLYFMAYQAVVIGAIYVLPESVSKWDDKEDANLSRWWHNATHPEMDDDGWGFNYATHPYWGANYYIRGRERGLDRQQSFLFSVALSTLYEFGWEALFEPVSIQDLVITPVLGSLLGEYVFTPIRANIRAKPGAPSGFDKTVLFLTDPLGVVGAWTERTFGVESSLTFQPIGFAARSVHAGLPSSQAHRADVQRPWGIQLQMAW